MNCKQVQEHLVEYLLRELSKADDQAVGRHLADGCQDCHSQLSILRSGVDLLMDCIPDETTGRERQAEIHAFVMDRANKTRTAPISHTDFIPNRVKLSFDLTTFLYPVAFAAGLLLVLFVSPVFDGLHPSNHLSIVSTPQPALTFGAAIDDPAHFAVFASKPVDRTEQPAQDAIQHLLYDLQRQELHFFLQDASPPPTGEQFVLATVGDQGELKILSPLPLNGNGQAKAIVRPVSPNEALNILVVRQPSTETQPL